MTISQTGEGYGAVMKMEESAPSTIRTVTAQIPVNNPGKLYLDDLLFTNN
jgi:hypothetical protein